MKPTLKTLFLLLITLNMAGCDLGLDDEYTPPLKKHEPGDKVENLNKIQMVDEILPIGDQKDQYVVKIKPK